MKGVEESGRIRRLAWWNLLYVQNCAQAALLTMARAFSFSNTALLRAATNLEGGAVGCGSTCGVVTGGILGVGALLSRRTGSDPEGLEGDIYEISTAYRDWFRRRFGSTLCYERIHCRLDTLSGLISYLVPGDKVIRCVYHIGEALVWLVEKLRDVEWVRDWPGGRGVLAQRGPGEPHCSYSVLRILAGGKDRRVVSVGWASTGLAGGVAFGGEFCGALAGAILGLGLRYGYDPALMGAWGITRASVSGHRNLLRRWSLSTRDVADLPKEAFARCRYLTDAFGEKFGSLDCRKITGRRFSSASDMKAYLSDSHTCEEIRAWCGEWATRLLV